MKFEMEASEFQELFKNTKLQELEELKSGLAGDFAQIVKILNTMQEELNECRDKLGLPIQVSFGAPNEQAPEADNNTKE